MSGLRRILITGATGKQGGALISALLASPPTPPFHLVALTRNINSAKAQILAKRSNVSLLEGDLDDVAAIFKKSSEPFHGVFSVQVPLKPDVEEKQGKDLVDVAAANGVKYFVYASVERGGPEKSDHDPTPVKHFISKFNIEKHLKTVAAKTPSMRWAIIRPVTFMDNMTPDFFGRAFNTMWQLNGMDRKLQLVSSTDIGILAADIFKNEDEYAGRAISFATDDLSPREANEIFKRVIGKDMPTTYQFIARSIKYLLYDMLGAMFDWFTVNKFGAKPQEFMSKFPEMKNFERWLSESSGFSKQKKA